MNSLAIYASERPPRATRRSRSSSQSDLTAATPRGHSGCVDLRATNKPGATSQSDTLRSLASMVSEQARSDVFRATQPGRSRGDDPGATSSERHSQVAREETTRERPLAATCRGRSASICLGEFMISQGPFGHFIMHVFTSENLCFKYLQQPPDILSFVLRKTFGKFIS